MAKGKHYFVEQQMMADMRCDQRDRAEQVRS